MGMGKIESVVLVGQKSVICYIQMVVVALLSVYLVESVHVVSVELVVNCISYLIYLSFSYLSLKMEFRTLIYSCTHPKSAAAK